MRLDKLTAKFQNALADAQSLAVGRDHQFIEPLHVMAALLDQQGGTARHLLGAAGVDVKGLRSRVYEALGRLPRVEGTGGEVTSRATSKAPEPCDKYAQERRISSSRARFSSSPRAKTAAMGESAPVGDERSTSQCHDTVAAGEGRYPNARRAASLGIYHRSHSRAREGKLIRHRTRRRDRRHPGPATPYKTTRSDRRAGVEDRIGEGCAPHRERRCPGEPEGPTAARLEWGRSSQAPSSAAIRGTDKGV